MYPLNFKLFSSVLFVLNMYHDFQIVRADSVPLFEIWDSSISNESLIRENVVVTDVPENCSETLDLFTEKVSSLTRCIILNARPVRVCTHCEGEINATEVAYNQLQEETSSCKKFYFESDQIGIINLVYSQGRDMWSNCFCQNCYNNLNDTQEFFKASQELDDCIKHFNKTSKGLNDTCNTCQSSFVKMNDIYKTFLQQMKDDASDRICMDIVDQMNITRHLWHSQHCLKFDSNIGYPNIVSTVLVGCIPVLFYVFSKNVSIIEDVQLVQPKRKSYNSLQSESLQIPE